MPCSLKNECSCDDRLIDTLEPDDGKGITADPLPKSDVVVVVNEKGIYKMEIKDVILLHYTFFSAKSALPFLTGIFSLTAFLPKNKRFLKEVLHNDGLTDLVLKIVFQSKDWVPRLHKQDTPEKSAVTQLEATALSELPNHFR